MKEIYGINWNTEQTKPIKKRLEIGMKKVLIAEQGKHFKVLDNIYHLLNGKCSLLFYVNASALDRISFFPNIHKSKLIINRFHNSFFFLWLLFFGWRYDYINISTGPESRSYRATLHVIFFYIFCFLYRKKIILTIRKVPPYLKITGDILSFIRSQAIKYLKRFTFETETLKNYFIQNADIEFESCFLGVSYDRYSDLLKNKSACEFPQNNSDMIKIGLLGSINKARRNYESVINELSKLPLEKKSRLMFLNLGHCKDGSEGEVVKGFSRHVAFNCQKGFLSAEDFDERGTSCDLLLSPLKEGYGKHDGSGSFGDAVYLKKRIILPRYLDDREEIGVIAI